MCDHSNETCFAVLLHLPNRTFLVRFGGKSGEFGRAMVRVLARRSRAKIPIARLKEHNMSPKRKKKVIFLAVTVIKSDRRPIVWPARRIIRVTMNEK